MKREAQRPTSGAGKRSIAAGRSSSPTREQADRARGGQKEIVEVEKMNGSEEQAPYWRLTDEQLAARIRSRDYWLEDEIEELCSRAGMWGVWAQRAAPVEKIAQAAARVLGVRIS